MTKTCSECEGEGQLCRWGVRGHEVPASRRKQYPRDRPMCPATRDGRPYLCPMCQGQGVIHYDRSGNPVPGVEQEAL